MRPPGSKMHTKHPRRLQRGHPDLDSRLGGYLRGHARGQVALRDGLPHQPASSAGEVHGARLTRVAWPKSLPCPRCSTLSMQIRASANRTVCVTAYRSIVGPGAPVRFRRGSMSSATFTHSSRMPGTRRLGRGPVRGPGRRIIPAPRVPSVRWPVLSVQLAHAQPPRVPLVTRRSSVRSR